MDYKDIANRLRKWANGETCEDCPAKDDLAFCAADAITYLLDELSELEAKNIRLQGQVENANVACAKWEGLYRAKLEKKAAWVRVKDRLPETDGIYIVTACDEGFPYGEGIWYSTVVVCAEYYKGDWVWYEGSQEYSLEGIVTHWMPLPEPPKETRNA